MKSSYIKRLKYKKSRSKLCLRDLNMKRTSTLDWVWPQRGLPRPRSRCGWCWLALWRWWWPSCCCCQLIWRCFSSEECTSRERCYQPVVDSVSGADVLSDIDPLSGRRSRGDDPRPVGLSGGRTDRGDDDLVARQTLVNTPVGHNSRTIFKTKI